MLERAFPTHSRRYAGTRRSGVTSKMSPATAPDNTAGINHNQARRRAEKTLKNFPCNFRKGPKLASLAAYQVKLGAIARSCCGATLAQYSASWKPGPKKLRWG